MLASSSFWRQDDVLLHMLTYPDFPALANIKTVCSYLRKHVETFESRLPSCTINWARLAETKVTATSSWDDSPREAPINLLDGTRRSWWSSAQLDLENPEPVDIIINLGKPRECSEIRLIWGDDEGRARQAPSAFSVEVSRSEKRSSFVRILEKTNILPVSVHEYRRMYSGVHVIGDNGSITVIPTPPTLLQIQYIRIICQGICPRWVNHALQEVCIFGQVNKRKAEYLALKPCHGAIKQNPIFILDLDCPPQPPSSASKS